MTNLPQDNQTLTNDPQVEPSRTNASDQDVATAVDSEQFPVYVSHVQAAQVMLLEREGVIDSAASNAMLRIIDTVHLSTRPSEEPVWKVVASIEDRVDAALPGEIAGAASLSTLR